MALLGKMVYVTKASNPYYGYRGIVKGFNGYVYLVALENGERKVFRQAEFTVA